MNSGWPHETAVRQSREGQLDGRVAIKDHGAKTGSYEARRAHAHGPQIVEGGGGSLRRGAGRARRESMLLPRRFAGPFQRHARMSTEEKTLGLLDVTAAACLAASYQKIGLAAEKKL